MWRPLTKSHRAQKEKDNSQIIIPIRLRSACCLNSCQKSGEWPLKLIWWKVSLKAGKIRSNRQLQYGTHKTSSYKAEKEAAQGSSGALRNNYEWCLHLWQLRELQFRMAAWRFCLGSLLEPKEGSWRGKMTYCKWGCVWKRGPSQVALMVKKLPTNARERREIVLIPGWRRSPGGENGNSLQYSCLENPMERGAWRATVHGAAESWTWLKWHSMSREHVSHPLGLLRNNLRAL